MQQVDLIAQAILDGFNRHYRLFREISARASEHFEHADWDAGLRDSSERIRMYELRVAETVKFITENHPEAGEDYALWPRIKLSYIGLLLDHLQVECAETFFNSVACRVLHRRYYHNEYIFWRPALNTENLEGSKETYRCYYPAKTGMPHCLQQILADAELTLPFDDLRRDVRRLEQALNERRKPDWKALPSYQFQILGSVFFRNKAAYLVGREINGDRIMPLIFAILRNADGKLYVDAVLTRRRDASILFSFTRAYFMTDMEVPSAYVSFLRSFMPTKSKVDLYATLGLQKQAKTLFYRQMQHHLKHSSDNFVIAPGIPGTVMLVFTLPSFPYVLKIIKDRFDPPKTSDRDHVRERYNLVKFHDRIGRMADTLEYSDVALPLERIEPELLDTLLKSAAGSVEADGDVLVIRHCYIERRMAPLNDYLATASSRERDRVIGDFGRAIKELAGANIFPGDMMQKNFGVTRLGRVVFYDYDEIEYMTDCRFRRLPDTGDYLDDLSAEPWFSIEDHDVFPETFGPFFFPDPQQREIFLRSHADLMTPEFWRETQELIREGGRADVFPYPDKIRFEVSPG